MEKTTRLNHVSAFLHHSRDKFIRGGRRRRRIPLWGGIRRMAIRQCSSYATIADPRDCAIRAHCFAARAAEFLWWTIRAATTTTTTTNTSRTNTTTPASTHKPNKSEKDMGIANVGHFLVSLGGGRSHGCGCGKQKDIKRKTETASFVASSFFCGGSSTASLARQEQECSCTTPTPTSATATATAAATGASSSNQSTANCTGGRFADTRKHQGSGRQISDGNGKENMGQNSQTIPNVTTTTTTR